MSDKYRRDGTPYPNTQAGTLEWAKDHSNLQYKRVAETMLPNGKWVSTVWLGLDHSFGDGPPLIFETMVFASKDDLQEEDCERYSTEAQAIAGHDAMVAKWTGVRQ